MTDRFRFSAMPIAGVSLVERHRIDDARGHLVRLFCSDAFTHHGWAGDVAQINQTATLQRGTVRGMHYQLPPHVEHKLVNCLKGRMWDVVVDLRADSPTFLQWHGQVLDADRNEALLIPPGCAHGFQTLTDDVEIFYVHSAPYIASAEAGLCPIDPLLRIDWPLPISQMSPRDSGQPHLSSEFTGLRVS